MDVLMPLLMVGLALFGAVALIAGYESRDGYGSLYGNEPRDR